MKEFTNILAVLIMLAVCITGLYYLQNHIYSSGYSDGQLETLAKQQIEAEITLCLSSDHHYGFWWINPNYSEIHMVSADDSKPKCFGLDNKTLTMCAYRYYHNMGNDPHICGDWLSGIYK